MLHNKCYTMNDAQLMLYTMNVTKWILHNEYYTIKVAQWTQLMLHNESYTMYITQWMIHIENCTMNSMNVHNESYTMNTINVTQWMLHNESYTFTMKVIYGFYICAVYIIQRMFNKIRINRGKIYITQYAIKIIK